MVDEPRQPGQPSQSGATTDEQRRSRRRTHPQPTRPGCRHRCRRPDRLQPFVQARQRVHARPDQPSVLQLLEIPEALGALKGVVMELEDCAFPLLAESHHQLRPVEVLRRR